MCLSGQVSSKRARFSHINMATSTKVIIARQLLVRPHRQQILLIQNKKNPKFFPDSLLEKNISLLRSFAM